MPVPAETIFTAEQIRIPAEFPDLLKNYSKFIIRTQPKDLLVASAEYFHQLATSKPAIPKNKLSEMQLEALFSRLHSIGAVASTELVKGAALEAQIPKQRIDEIVSLGGWSEQVPSIQFWALACASATSDLLATMELAIRILAMENNVIDVAIVKEVYGFLAERDPNASKAATNVKAALEQAGASGRRDELIALVQRASTAQQ